MFAAELKRQPVKPTLFSSMAVAPPRPKRCWAALKQASLLSTSGTPSSEHREPPPSFAKMPLVVVVVPVVAVVVTVVVVVATPWQMNCSVGNGAWLAAVAPGVTLYIRALATVLNAQPLKPTPSICNFRGVLMPRAVAAVLKHSSFEPMSGILKSSQLEPGANLLKVAPTSVGGATKAARATATRDIVILDMAGMAATERRCERNDSRGKLK
mmetsp:Transcript_17727/g.40049  ORF Transcript_17727/g.40049 Transcript_17727/m.40049 type:complete len:212 (-) Transcript_17727:17-652(-)